MLRILQTNGNINLVERFRPMKNMSDRLLKGSACNNTESTNPQVPLPETEINSISSHDIEMKDIISEKHKHLLWKGERGDTFLILKYGEIYRYSENTVMILTWSYPKRITIVRKNIVINEDAFDDGLYGLLVNRSNLSFLVDLGSFRRRPDLKGSWIKGREALLGHRIIPYNPQLLNKIDDKVGKLVKGCPGIVEEIEWGIADVRAGIG